MSNLTQIGSGGVERPDVTLREDLAAIQQTANTAKQTADNTASLLETRVPIGRTINSKPMDRDLVFTPEDLGTYSQSTIDQKIDAVRAGGYNPVRINGKLLDRDVILVPSDLNAYTAAEVNEHLAGYVPATRTINGIPLTGDITLDLSGNSYSKTEIDNKLLTKVSTSTTINGKPLTGNVSLSAADVGSVDGSTVVLKSFTLNNHALSGGSLTLTAADIPGVVSAAYVDGKVAGFIPYANQYGLAIAPDKLTKSSIGAIVNGSGFFEYENGSEDNGSGVITTTSVSDRPTGSNSGRIIALSNRPTVDSNGNITTPARQDLLAFPDDLDGLMFKKSGQAWTELGVLQVDPGLKGDIPFANLNGSKKFSAERLAKSLRIIDTQNDLAAEQANPVSFATIFNTWSRVGMVNAPSGVDETQQWTVNQTNGQIQCTMNTSGPTGFVSPNRYDKYTLEVQIASTDVDDDGIGIILASTYKDGVNHVLAATRSVGGWPNIWEVALYQIQAESFTKTVLTSLNLPLKWGNGAYGATRTDSGYVENNGIGWNTFPTGVKILAVRNSSSITLQTTDLGSATYVTGANLTVDLTTIENGLFLAPAQYGMLAYSQAAATFTTIQLTVDDNHLYDVRNGDIWEYSTSWTKIAGSAYDHLKEGRQYYNPYTKKTFFAESGTRIVPMSLGVNDAVIKNSDGLIDKPVILKNNVALRVEATPGSGTTRDVVSMTPAGVLTIGSSGAHTTIYSGDAPTVKIGSVESKIVTESSVPTGDNLGAMTFAKCSSVVAFGANVSGANLKPAAIGTGGVVAGTATLTGTWKCLGEISAVDQATLFMKTA